MRKLNIKLLRHNAKQILLANYPSDWKVVVRASGAVELYCPQEDRWRCEGNIFKDEDISHFWSRYCVERMVNRDIEFESWFFHTKTEAMEKLVELIKEDNGWQANLLDFGHMPNRVIRVSCMKDRHLIEIMSRFVKKRDFHMLHKVQQELQSRRNGYKTIECKVVQEW